jgi:hypothetical protein
MVTLGLDYVPHKYTHEITNESYDIKIWDTAG